MDKTPHVVLSYLSPSGRVRRIVSTRPVPEVRLVLEEKIGTDAMGYPMWRPIFDRNETAELLALYRAMESK